MFIERLVTGVILLFSLVFLLLIMPMQVEKVSYGRIVPATLPTILLWIIAVTALIQLFTIKSEFYLNRRSMVRSLILIGVMVTAIWLMQTYSFELIAPILALTVMLFLGETRWFWLLLGSLGIPLGIWLLVEVVLNRSLA